MKLQEKSYFASVAIYSKSHPVFTGLNKTSSTLKWGKNKSDTGERKIYT